MGYANSCLLICLLIFKNIFRINPIISFCLLKIFTYNTIICFKLNRIKLQSWPRTSKKQHYRMFDANTISARRYACHIRLYCLPAGFNIQTPNAFENRNVITRIFSKCQEKTLKKIVSCKTKTLLKVACRFARITSICLRASNTRKQAVSFPEPRPKPGKRLWERGWEAGRQIFLSSFQNASKTY